MADHGAGDDPSLEMNPVLGQVALSVVASLVCYRSDPVAQGPPQERVQHARDEVEAAASLEAWDAYLTKAREFAARADPRSAMTQIEQAMQLVKRWGIWEEGATYDEAYALLQRIPTPQKNGMLLELLADENLVEAKGAIVSLAVAHLELDSKAREQLMARPQDKQVEALRGLLTR
jgi:hypothetical protein